ncbi:hypothetical protein EDC01DRAFT_785114 [Geopyxis carbonaria]|nr:hypothetical protein EDC01DRAFT_785114 [Geopyxis carbonaria]
MPPKPQNSTFLYNSVQPSGNASSNSTIIVHDPIVVRNRNLVAGFLVFFVVACIFGLAAYLEWRHEKMLRATREKKLERRRAELQREAEVVAQAEAIVEESIELEFLEPVYLEETPYLPTKYDEPTETDSHSDSEVTTVDGRRVSIFTPLSEISNVGTEIAVPADDVQEETPTDEQEEDMPYGRRPCFLCKH